MRKKLLLVEDDRADQSLMAYAIDQVADVDLMILSDGQQALEYLQAHAPGTPQAPSVVFLDLQMPNVNGFEVLRELQKHAGARRLPIVVFTGASADADIYLSYRFGANAFVVKPQAAGRLQEIVKAAATFWLHSNVLPLAS